MNILPVWSAVLLIAGAGSLAAAEERRDDVPTLPAAMRLADADEPAPEAEAQEKKWRFDFAVYLWMADLEGDFTIGPVTGEADAEFGDLLDHLKIAGTLHFEAWSRDRVGILADLNWMAFEDENDLGPGPLEVTVTQTVGITEGAAGFRIKEGEAYVDLIAGLRWIFVDTEVEIDGTPKESEAHSYLDPIVGIRFGLEAADWLLLSFRADVGGFGVGTDMEGSMTALAAFRLSPMFAVIAGYRSFAMEITDDDSSIDLRMKGPLLAFDIGF